MSEIVVKLDKRVWKRLLNPAFQKSIVKSIAELVSNSDCSYQDKFERKNGIKYPSNWLVEQILKLNVGGVLDIKNLSIPEYKFKKEQIIIKCFRTQKPKIQVIDYAEGMSYKEMYERFEKFGKDQGGYVRGRRGLFGQGLMQVLFSHNKGNFISIKDDEVAKSIFTSGDSGPVIKPSNIGRARKDIRQKFQIENGNGSFVEFALNEECRLLHKDPIISQLSNFYILRVINTDPLREVILEQYRGNDLLKRNTLKYTMPTGEVIFKGNIVFSFESFPQITGEIIILRHEAPLNQSGDDREGGLRVVDEKDAVCDLTFFEYDRNAYIDRLFGILKLKGVREVIKDKLDKGEVILTDSRNGFDKGHPFYVALSDALAPILKEVINKEAEEKKEQEAELSPETRKRHKEAFNELNKLYEELTGEKPTGEIEPTRIKVPDYIEFDRESIRAIVDKSNRIFLYVNASKVENGQIIKIYSSNQKINVSPETIEIDIKAQKDGVLFSSIIIQSSEEGSTGTITAETNGIAGEGKDDISVVIVPPFFYVPVDGLEFYPKYATTSPDRSGVLNLFLNTEKIPIGSEIKLNSNNKEIEVSPLIFTLDESIVIKGTKIARKKINFGGGGIGQRATIKAEYTTESGIVFSDEAEVCIVSRKEPPPPLGGGRFNKVVYLPLDRRVQSFFNVDNGEIIVNSKHPINIQYFGRDALDYKNAIETLLHSQLLLAELVLGECLFEAISKAYINGKLTEKLGPATDIRNYVEEKKFEIGVRIHKLFVTKQLP